MWNQLTFFAMSIRDNPPCNESYVDVLNGYMVSSPSIGRFCVITRRFLRSQSNHLRLVYHTNSTVARNNRFRIMYRVQRAGIRVIGRPSAVLIAEFDLHLYLLFIYILRSPAEDMRKSTFSLYMYVQTNSNLFKQIKNLFKQNYYLFKQIGNLFELS